MVWSPETLKKYYDAIKPSENGKLVFLGLGESPEAGICMKIKITAIIGFPIHIRCRMRSGSIWICFPMPGIKVTGQVFGLIIINRMFRMTPIPFMKSIIHAIPLSIPYGSISMTMRCSYREHTGMSPM